MKALFIIVFIGIVVSAFIFGQASTSKQAIIQTKTIPADTTNWSKLKQIDDHLLERKDALIYQYSLPDGNLTDNEAADKALLMENIRTDIEETIKQRLETMKKLGY